MKPHTQARALRALAAIEELAMMQNHRTLFVEVVWNEARRGQRKRPGPMPEPLDAGRAALAADKDKGV